MNKDIYDSNVELNIPVKVIPLVANQLQAPD